MPETDADKAPPLPPDVQAKIGEKLKAMYDDVVSQPVPDRFRELLARLDGTGTESHAEHTLATRPTSR